MEATVRTFVPLDPRERRWCGIRSIERQSPDYYPGIWGKEVQIPKRKTNPLEGRARVRPLQHTLLSVPFWGQLIPVRASLETSTVEGIRSAWRSRSGCEPGQRSI